MVELNESLSEDKEKRKVAFEKNQEIKNRINKAIDEYQVIEKDY